MRVVYSVNTPMQTKGGGTRYIPQSPERILDAPDIINDYCKILNKQLFCFQLFIEILLFIYVIYINRSEFNGLE